MRFSTAFYNDNDPYCCRVLRKQVAAGNLPGGMVDGRDVEDIDFTELAGYRQVHLFAGIGGIPLGLRLAHVPDTLSILTGGFPCQDISRAGRRAGIHGDRSSLWREIAHAVCDLRPRFVLVENTPSLLVRGMSVVLGDLAALGYDAEWDCLPAASFGAPHIRDRLFLLAERKDPVRNPLLYDALRRRHGAPKKALFAGRGGVELSARWAGEPSVCRVAHGLPRELDRFRRERIRMLGNALVPQVVEWIGRRLLAALGHG